jgi:hypothetical protein
MGEEVMPRREPKIRFAKYHPNLRWKQGFFLYDSKPIKYRYGETGKGWYIRDIMGSLRGVTFSRPKKDGKKKCGGCK